MYVCMCLLIPRRVTRLPLRFHNLFTTLTRSSIFTFPFSILSYILSVILSFLLSRLARYHVCSARHARSFLPLATLDFFARSLWRLLATLAHFPHFANHPSISTFSLSPCEFRFSLIHSVLAFTLPPPCVPFSAFIPPCLLTHSIFSIHFSSHLTLSNISLILSLIPPSSPLLVLHRSNTCFYVSSSFPHTLHFFFSSVHQYLSHLISFPILHLTILLYLSSFQRDFKYFGIPSTLISLYHLLLSDCSILSRLSLSCSFLSPFSIVSYASIYISLYYKTISPPCQESKRWGGGIILSP